MWNQIGHKAAGAIGILLAAALALASPPTSNVDQLVQQLGSPRFGEREQAALDLERLGAPALESLQKAVKHPDAEVRRRAEELVRVIERRLQSERLLVPTRLKLDYRDTPLPDAVADLAKRAGCAIDLQNRDKLAHRTVTLQTAEIPFWQALAAFCDSAQVTLLTSDLSGRPQAARDVDAIRAQMEMELRRQAVVQQGFAQPFPQQGAGPAPRLVLVDQKPAERPTMVAGAVRVRALPATGGSRNERETTVVLEVYPEPKLAWRGLLGVRIEKAIDEANQAYAQTPTDNFAGGGGDPEVVLWQNGNGVIVQQMQVRGQVILRGDLTGNPYPGLVGSPTVTNVRLTASEGAGKTLKVLKGLLFAQVQAPTEPLVSVEELLRNDGRTRSYSMKDGGELILRNAIREDNGDVRLRLALVRPGNVAVPAPRQLNGRPGDTDLSANLDLVDETGERYVMLDQAVTHVMNNGAVSRELNARFRPKTTTAQPKRLQYVGTRLAVVDIPFELKDVPLP